jgi:hypothetical protein
MLMPKDDSRAGQLNANIDPKLLFLAKLAARSKGQSLIEFIEDAFRRALTREAMLSDEPKVAEPTGPMPEPVLWFDSLWAEDEVVRLYRVATIGSLNLLTPKQRNIFLYVSNELIKQGKKVTLKNFVECFDASERVK